MDTLTRLWHAFRCRLMVWEQERLFQLWYDERRERRGY